ncbi:hypothetical protein LY76DRAFT_225372 [Colletotrichum caudatum]|nr:hypothetical protein LY76DRAFT_225372 [Colletotrichum caudatum]
MYLVYRQDRVNPARSPRLSLWIICISDRIFHSQYSLAASEISQNLRTAPALYGMSIPPIPRPPSPWDGGCQGCAAQAEPLCLCRNSNPSQPLLLLLLLPLLLWPCPVLMSYSFKLASLTRHILIQTFLRRIQPVPTSLDSFCPLQRMPSSPPIELDSTTSIQLNARPLLTEYIVRLRNIPHLPPTHPPTRHETRRILASSTRFMGP